MDNQVCEMRGNQVWDLYLS